MVEAQIDPTLCASRPSTELESAIARPFQWALGQAGDTLRPLVKEHVFLLPGTVATYRGRMRVWRDQGWKGVIAGFLLRFGTLSRTMFPETGEEVDFTLRHEVAAHEDGSLSMTWKRTYQFGRVTRQFDALMRFHNDQPHSVRWIGCFGCLHVELCPTVEDGAIFVQSRREWVKLGPIWIPIPEFLKGRPDVREWEDPDGHLRIRVAIHNTFLGQFFGYEGCYKRVE
jgi:hypothetical protein